MRVSAVAALVLLAALVPVPFASAAGALLEDAKGDVSMGAGFMGTEVPPVAATESAAHADLTSLAIVESEDALTFVVAVAGLKGDPVSSFYSVQFSWGSQDYALSQNFFKSALLGTEGRNGALFAVDDDEWNRVATLPPEVDVEKGTLTTVVPKVYVLDSEDRAPGRGDVLADVRVYAQSTAVPFGFFNLRYVDYMPDDESGAASFTLQMGDFSEGSLRLGSPERVRVSNGGSTTFVFLATLANVGEREGEFELSLDDLPQGWNASVQSPVKVPPQSERTVAILASVPFAHDHGGFDAFNLTVQGKTDPASKGRMRFGVLHTPIPQPAGHHSDLYLHAAPRTSNAINDVVTLVDPYGHPTLSTAPEHEGEAPAATINDYSGTPSWIIALNPALRMGLDFDLERTGTLVGTLENVHGDATLAATLVLATEDGDEVVLAEAEPVAVKGSPNAQVPFAFTLVPTPESDYVPHALGQNMYLVMAYEGGPETLVGDPTLPRLPVEPFKLTLPLNEYHDRLTGVADAAAVLDLVAEGAVEKAGRPATIVTYAFTLKNGGAAEDRFEIDLAGSDSRHGEVVPRGVLALAAGESRRVTVAVSIPPNAAAGEELEVLLFAHGVDDPSKTAIARTKTKVSLGSDAVDDESSVLIAARQAENGTPGPGLALLALAAALAALVASRRRR